MSTLAAVSHDDGHAPQKNYLNEQTTVMSWLNTRDHKRVALMFLVSVLINFAMGGFFAMLIRLELLTPERTIMGASMYNRVFTLHGVSMIFLFMIPAIPSVFGNFFLPLMIGAKDVAFPRLNLATFYIYWLGAALVLTAMLRGGLDTGWTFYAPYSTTTLSTVVPALCGVFMLGMGSILTGLNFIVTTHTMRAPGMTWFKMPLFVWGIYATSIIQVFATPVLGMTVLLVAIEHAFGFGLFDPAQGGDPVLMQHLFWFYSHPAVYIMVLPAMAVISEVIQGISKKNMFGYRSLAFASMGIAFVGFFIWGHHMFVSGQSTFGGGVFGVLTMLVGIFTAVKVFNWVGTLYRGSILMNACYVYVCGFLYFIVFGGMTGICLGVISLDLHWHDTYFIVAHFHFIMVGATIMGFLAAIHYWFPKMFGKMYPENIATASAIVIIIGFNVTFVPQFFLGNAGMPRRYYSYPPEFTMLNDVSTAGAFVLGFGLLMVLIYLSWSLKNGEKAPHNPWESRGHEWLTDSPPIAHNFHDQPTFEGMAHDYTTKETVRVA